MIGFDELKRLMRSHLERDASNAEIEAQGASLEDALSAAATELGVKVKDLEYEIVEEGSKGILGKMGKKWKILAYPALQKEEAAAVAESFDEEIGVAVPVEVDKNGEAFVMLSHEGVLLKVTPPQGKGRRATERMAHDRLKARGVQVWDSAIVSRAVEEASGEWIRVADFIANPANDAILTVEIGDQEMKAYVYISQPGPGGCDVSAETLLSFLRNNRVVYGVKEDVVRELEERPRYKEMVLVAEGTRPVNGRDAYLQYNFSVEKEKIRLKEVDGKVNFKELNIVKNVVQGQPLARKVQPEKGIPGYTVTGKMLPAKSGKDIAIQLGKNVHVADDGLTVIADQNGQVLLVGGKINVEPVYTVQGDVDLRVGNIIFLGTVIVNGNVEDGFTVKAAGNIEVLGNVGKSELDAEGDIIVHQGINGKSGGMVRAGNSVWAKFIQNSNIEAGEHVVVSDGIMNSVVKAKKKIICQGKRAAIVGGHLMASEEINAKTLGSDGGGETTLEVGYDPKVKEEIDELQAQKGPLKKQLEEIDLNLYTLAALKKQKKELSEEKEASLRELVQRKGELTAQMKAIDDELQKRYDYLNNLKLRGKISASGRVYPGVRLIIKDIKEEIKTDYAKNVTYILENNLIRATKYEEIEEDLEAERRKNANQAD
jgi:hypothetical protein